MSLTPSCLRSSVAVVFVAAFLFLSLIPVNSTAQDSTLFVEGFYSFQVGRLASGCGDMTSGAWRWSSHHSNACYSAGWGIKDVGSANNKLHLWGGVSSGGGDCTVCAWEPKFEGLTDYSLRAKITPLEVTSNVQGCKGGMVGIVGRVEGVDAFCTGYLLALSLNNGASQCNQGTSLQLLCNDRGQSCDGSESMTVLASQELNISVGASGKLDPMTEYVLTLDIAGSDIWGGSGLLKIGRPEVAPRWLKSRSRTIPIPRELSDCTRGPVRPYSMT